MTKFLSFDLSDAYREIKERGEAEAIISQEAFSELCDEYINDKIDVGEIDRDDDTEGMIEQLKGMWPEYEKNLEIH